MDCPSSTPETAGSIAAWSVATFGPIDTASPRGFLRLLEEVVELCIAAGANTAELHSRVLGVQDSTDMVWIERRPDPAGVPAEMADVNIVLLNLAGQLGIDLDGATAAKMAVNRHKREWISAGDGTGYHKKNP